MNRNMVFSREMQPITILQRCLEEKLLSISNYIHCIFNMTGKCIKTLGFKLQIISPFHLILGYCWGICWLRGWSAPIAACRNIIRGWVRRHFWRQERVRLDVVVTWWQWTISVWDCYRIWSHFRHKVWGCRLVEEGVLAGGRVACAVGGAWQWGLHC